MVVVEQCWLHWIREEKKKKVERIESLHSQKCFFLIYSNSLVSGIWNPAFQLPKPAPYGMGYFVNLGAVPLNNITWYPQVLCLESFIQRSNARQSQSMTKEFLILLFTTILQITFIHLKNHSLGMYHERKIVLSLLKEETGSSWCLRWKLYQWSMENGTRKEAGLCDFENMLRLLVWKEILEIIHHCIPRHFIHNLLKTYLIFLLLILWTFYFGKF